MKWIRRVVIAMVLLIGVLVALAVSTALRPERPVGFQPVTATTAGGQRFAMGVWYPTTSSTRPTTLLGLVLMDVAPDGNVAGNGLPLVVISHGNGGGPGGHADLALALATAGYVVAAPMHTGDNYADQGSVGSASYLGSRTTELSAAIDHMLTRWPERARIDPNRIGAYGFSAGGLTVLTAAGARPDLAYVATYCAKAKEFACDLLRQAGSPLLDAGAKVDDKWASDARIKAAVVAAPGLGFALRADGFANVNVPVQLWSAEHDTSVPYATNTGPVREALGPRAEYHEVRGAGHFSFLVPCGLLGPPLLCKDAEEFDRKAFHAAMNRSVVAFFDRHMPGR
ncbi:MAG TPA: dienelactone hydrolase family protein [Telluria sp.]|nr:dienelactone hydrolase family protein [Telluria sp.]